MTTSEEKLNEIVGWLNKNYNQDSENYNIFVGAKREVIRYDEHTAISFWGCGAIVCIGSILYFIGEDDGHWYLIDAGHGVVGLQSHFSVFWADGFADAMKSLVKYTEENGKPIYFSGTKNVCNYTL